VNFSLLFTIPTNKFLNASYNTPENPPISSGIKLENETEIKPLA